MSGKKVRFHIDDYDDIWTILRKLLEELKKQKPRRRFSKFTKQAVLANQNQICRKCFTFLDVVEFDHINGDRSNNSYENCQALCPTCHARKTRKKLL